MNDCPHCHGRQCYMPGYSCDPFLHTQTFPVSCPLCGGNPYAEAVEALLCAAVALWRRWRRRATAWMYLLVSSRRNRAQSRAEAATGYLLLSAMVWIVAQMLIYIDLH